MQLSGKSASSGIVVGRALVLKIDPIVIDPAPTTNVDAEIKRFRAALAKSKADLGHVRDAAMAAMGADKAAIFESHMMLVEDPELTGEVEALIRGKNQNAAQALSEVAAKFVAVFEAMDNEYMRERAADVRDVTLRMQRNLAGIEVPDLSTVKDPFVLVAHDLSPSETAVMDPKKVLGILTNVGGKTGHTAIVARTLEIPAVLGLKRATEVLKSGDWVAFDGDTGEVVASPDETTRAQFLRDRERQQKDNVELRALVGQPNASADGVVVGLMGNIGSPQDLGVLKKYDAAGVGLFRTEFLFMDRPTMPSEDEQYEAYKTVLESLAGKPATIRTIDIGGDKPVPFMKIGKEENPFLGYRAVRYCLDHPELFGVQLRALLRASVHGHLKIMFPMISSLEELQRCKAQLEAARAELKAKGVAVAEKIPVGVMIEIPSAAVISDILAQNCDFLSIGTNDLIQYTVAVDRLNERVQDLYDPFHPGVLRLIRTVIENGHKYGVKVSMCGEMGGSPLHLPLLFGLGLDEFSMAPTSILRLRRQLKGWKLPEAKALVEEVFSKSRSQDIEAALERARTARA